MIKIALVFIFVIALIAIFAGFLKKFGNFFLNNRRNSASSMIMLEEISLDYKRKVTLISCCEKKYLVFTCGDAITVIEHKDL